MGEKSTPTGRIAQTAGANVPILANPVPQRYPKTGGSGEGSWRRVVCRNGTATGAEPGESCGGVFSVGCGVGNQEPLKESHSQAAQRSKKKIMWPGGRVVVEGGVGSGLNTTPQRSQPSGHRKESSSQIDAHRAGRGENRGGGEAGNKKGRRKR